MYCSFLQLKMSHLRDDTRAVFIGGAEDKAPFHCLRIASRNGRDEDCAAAWGYDPL